MTGRPMARRGGDPLDPLLTLCEDADGVAALSDARHALALFGTELTQLGCAPPPAGAGDAPTLEPAPGAGGRRVRGEQLAGALRREALRRQAPADSVRTAAAAAAHALRRALRRRFLMFADAVTGAGVDQPALALQLSGSARGLAMYEELFATGCRAAGCSGALPLSALEHLLRIVCPGQAPRELREMLRVAHVPPGASGIDLSEFVLLMRGARLPRCLGDMVTAARRYAEDHLAADGSPAAPCRVVASEAPSMLSIGPDERARAEREDLDLRVSQLDALRRALFGSGTQDLGAAPSPQTSQMGSSPQRHASPPESPRSAASVRSTLPAPPQAPEAKAAAPAAAAPGDAAARQRMAALESQVLEQRRRAQQAEQKGQPAGGGGPCGGSGAGRAAAADVARSYAEFLALQSRQVASGSAPAVAAGSFEPYQQQRASSPPGAAAARAAQAVEQAKQQQQQQQQQKQQEQPQQEPLPPAAPLPASRHVSRNLSRRTPGAVGPDAERLQRWRKLRSRGEAAAGGSVLVAALGSPAERLSTEGLHSSEDAMRRLAALRSAGDGRSARHG